MRAVLYSDYDMEPITVMDIPTWAQKMLVSGERVHFVPPPEPIFTPYRQGEPVKMQIQYVTIWAESVVRRGNRHLLLFTSNDELAMKLKAGFLPGQRNAVQEKYRAGLEQGFMDALNVMRKIGGQLGDFDE